MSEGGNKVKKTRNRVPTSCDQCRKRKLKCDRGNPCSNCVKSSTEGKCKYALNIKHSNSSAKIQLNSEIIKLKLKINQMEKILKLNNIDPNDYTDMLTGDYSSSPESSIGGDPVLSMTEKFGALVVKENKILHSGSTSFVTFVNSDQKLMTIFKPYFNRHKVNYEDYLRKQRIKASDIADQPAELQHRWLLSNSSNALSSCDVNSLENFKGPAEANAKESKILFEIIEDINKVMPPMFIVRTLIDNFFKYVYPLFPYVNEEIFREEIELVLVPAANGGCQVSITHFQNASIISLLLIVLRYSFLTINIKDLKDNMEEVDDKILALVINSGVKIDHKFVLFAKTLLMSLPSSDAIFRKVTLRNIQVLLYLRLYQIFSPELSEEGTEHTLTLALLIQMIRSLGGHLDPEHFPEVYTDRREITIRRRIFYKLLILDVTSAFHYGTPLIIHDGEWTMKLPTLSQQDLHTLANFKRNLPVDRSIQDINKLLAEDSINAGIALEHKFYNFAKEGLSVFQNFTSCSRKSQFIAVVKKMENFIHDKLPCLYELLNETGQTDNVDNVFNLKKFEIRLSFLLFIQTFYYLLYLMELENGESPDLYTFALKATEASMILFKIAHDYSRYVTQNSKANGDSKSFRKFKNFSRHLECYIFNVLLTVCQRSLLWISSMFLRNLEDNSITIESLMKNFGNDFDSSMVLNWFNVDIESPEQNMPNKELMVLIFNYCKDFFFTLQQMKGDFFMAWRNSAMVQMFINTFRQQDDESCKYYMNCDINPNSDEALCTFTDLTSDSYDKVLQGSNDTSPAFTNNSSYSGKTQGREYNDVQMVNNKDISNLFYDNFDNLVEDIFTDTEKHANVFKKFDLFNTGELDNSDPLEGFINDYVPLHNSVSTMESKPSLLSAVGPPTSLTSNSSYDNRTGLTPVTGFDQNGVVPHMTHSFLSPSNFDSPIDTVSDGNQLLADLNMSSSNIENDKLSKML